MIIGNKGQANQLFIGDGSGGFVEEFNSGIAIVTDRGSDDECGLCDWQHSSTGSHYGSYPMIIEFYDWTQSLAFGDVDNDGWIDLVVGNAAPNDANNRMRPSANYLFLNNYGVSSTSARSSTLTGFMQDNRTLISSVASDRTTFMVSLADFDNDGDLDLFVVNYGAVNELWWNKGDGTFVADTTTSILGIGANPDFGAVVADLDRDGDFDIVTTGFVSPNRYFRFVHCSAAGSAKSTTSGLGCLTRCPGYSKKHSNTLDACLECPEHTAADSTGGCGFCPPGQERGFGVDQCTSCALGTRQPATGSFCTPCSPGEYSPITGSVLCFPCSLGAHSPQPGAAQCTACGIGTYSSSPGASTCSLCPVGGFCASVGAASASQTFAPCPSGTYNPDEGASSAESCRACRPGKANPIPSSSLASACSSCLPGSYAGGNGTAVCPLCTPGKYQGSRGATACQDCTSGYLCVEGASSPQPCPGGTHANQTVLTVFGFLSTLDDCVICPTGTFCPVGSAAPTDCPPGTFNDQLNASTCVNCVAGTFQAVAGSTACEQCTPGCT